MPAEIGREPKDHIASKVKEGRISKADGKTILDFINDRKTTLNIMPWTAAGYARYLTQALTRIGKPVKGWDYQTFADYSEQAKKDYQPNSYRKAIGSLKLFILFLIENGIVTSIKAEQIKRVGLPKPNRMTKVASDMLSVDEVMKIIKGAKNSRNRAIIAMLFESGCRPSELLDMTWSDVNFDEYGATLNTAAKTGNPRRIRIISMTPHLVAWKNDYPGEPSGKNPLFVTLDTKDHHAMCAGSLKRIVSNAVEGSGVTKRVHPYLFRHSRVTAMLADGVPSSVVGLQFWGSLDSQMLRTYGHLSDVQTDTILLAHSGLKTAEKKEPEMKPILCPKCSSENPAGLTFCGRCGSVLDPEKYQESLESDVGMNDRVKQMEAELEKIKAEREEFKAMTDLMSKYVSEMEGKFTAKQKGK
jgi:integrase